MPVLGPPALDNSVARMGRAGQTAFCSWQWQGGSKAGSNPRPSRLAASDGDGVSGCASGRASSTSIRTLQVLKFLVIPSGLQPRRSSHQRSLNSHYQLPQPHPRFYKAVAALPTTQLVDASGPLSSDGAVSREHSHP